MSKGKYGSFEISEEQRKRLEEERIRRWEEERRQREERHCREEIAAEKERIALVKHFREMASNLRQQRVSPATGDRMPERKEVDLTEEMQALVQTMKEQVMAFPDSWRKYFADRLKPVQEIMHKVEVGGFDSYYYHQLKEAGRNLAALAATADQELEDRFRRVKKVREVGTKLLVEMEMVAEKSHLEEHRLRARTIVHSLSSLLQESRPDISEESRLEYLRQEGWRLWEEYTRSQEVAQARRFLLQKSRFISALPGKAWWS